MEQDLKLRNIYDALTKHDTSKEDIITVFMALQHQCFVLSNSLTNLVKKWPKTESLLTSTDQDTIKEVHQILGTLFEIKD